MFSPLHLFLILFTIVSVPYLCQAIINGGHQRVEKVLKGIALAIVFFDPAYWIWEYVTFGYFRWETTLPLYLCSLFWLLMPFAAFLKRGQMKQIALANIATVGLISGILGFVLNYHIDIYPIFSFVGIRTLLYHYLMIFTAALLWTSKYYQPKVGDQIRAFIPVLILLIPSLILNKLYGYDYGYTAGGQGTALTILSDNLPQLIFLIILYAVFFLIVWGLFYRKLPLFSKRISSI